MTPQAGSPTQAALLDGKEVLRCGEVATHVVQWQATMMPVPAFWHYCEPCADAAAIQLARRGWCDVRVRKLTRGEVRDVERRSGPCYALVPLEAAV